MNEKLRPAFIWNNRPKRPQINQMTRSRIHKKVSRNRDDPVHYQDGDMTTDKRVILVKIWGVLGGG